MKLSLVGYIWGTYLLFSYELWLVNEGNPYLINKYKGNKTIYFIFAKQAKRLINITKKSVMLIARSKAWKPGMEKDEDGEIIAKQ